MSADIRYDWTVDEILDLLQAPLLDLLHRAQTVHRAFNADAGMQLASLLSIKTGGCPEDCGYCPQSAHHRVDLKSEALVDLGRVLEAAREAKELGASRFCMGAAWREVRDGAAFDSVLEMVRGVRALGLEACVTLGMLTREQAARLAEAGLTALSLAINSSDLTYVLVDDSLHLPIRQELAIVSGTKNEELARRFVAFLTGAEGQTVMEKYGFLVPKEG